MRIILFFTLVSMASAQIGSVTFDHVSKSGREKVHQAVGMLDRLLQGKHCREFFEKSYGKGFLKKLKDHPAELDVSDTGDKSAIYIGHDRWGLILLSKDRVEYMCAPDISLLLVHELAHHADIVTDNNDDNGGHKTHEGDEAVRAALLDRYSGDEHDH